MPILGDKEGQGLKSPIEQRLESEETGQRRNSDASVLQS